jgi:hypothetical protein
MLAHREAALYLAQSLTIARAWGDGVVIGADDVMLMIASSHVLATYAGKAGGISAGYANIAKVENRTAPPEQRQSGTTSDMLMPEAKLRALCVPRELSAATPEHMCNPPVTACGTLGR